MQQFSFLRVGTALIALLVASGYAQAQGPAADALSTTSATAKQQVELEGAIEIIHEDFKHSGRYLYYLNTSGGRVPLHFGKNPPTHLLTGDHVRVRGRESGGTMIVDSGGSVTTMSTAMISPSGPLPNTFGPQSTIVILVNFQDNTNPPPYTAADAQNAIFATGTVPGATSIYDTFETANSFIQENSYGQTLLTGKVFGWYTIPDSITTCDTGQIATDAQNAAIAAGVNLSAYTRYVYMFPQNNACGFGGASYIGGNPSQSWINGTRNDGTGSDSFDMHTIDHELGHALGLWHSHSLDCGTSATTCTNGTVWEYGDILDTMGAVQTASPHYNAFQKERLGWLNYGASPSITTVTASGTYVLDTYELPGSGPNALKILKSTNPTTGANTWYYIEARQPVGFDAFLTNGTCEPCYTQNETNGVLVHIGTDNNGNTGDLLDMTPATPTIDWWFDPSLAVGQNFQDPAAGVTITTDWVTSTQAAVTVEFTTAKPTPTPASTPAPAQGTVTVATNHQSYLPGQTVSTTATAMYGGSPVANVSVTFTITKANGNVVTGSANTGKNGAAAYNLRLMKNDPAGTYVAGAATMIKGNPHSAATSFTVH